MTKETMTVEQLKQMIQEGRQAARDASMAFIEKHGELGYCGFAWTSIYGVKGNTKLGRALKKAGIEQAWDKSFQIWNPSGLGTQCMSTKEEGAQACAEVFRKYGFNAYMGSRAD